MRQLLTPRMIQSMEILQLPLLALEERIEEELQQNPVLEVREGDPEAPALPEAEDVSQESAADQRMLVVSEQGDQSEDFARLERISEYLDQEEMSFGGNLRHRATFEDEDGRDRKLEAMSNVSMREASIGEHLANEWALVECTDDLRWAGEIIIGYIGDDGYLRVPLEQIQAEQKKPIALEVLHAALKLVQTLDPPGIGARDLTECLLIQLDRLQAGEDPEMAEGHDFKLERTLIIEHLNDLKMNRYPQISRKLGRSIEDLQRAVRQIGRLNMRPGSLLGPSDGQPITPDATIVLNEDTGNYDIHMARDPSENLTLSMLYQKMLKDRAVDKKTREFLNNNARNAKWLIESIAQRKSTIERVIRVVVDAQREFFEKGPEFLKPLPMILVADQLGIHVATVSRAVSEKWIQTPRGIYPLRRFFSGGTTNAEGEDMSWDAVKEKLRVIIDNEDKNNPLNDDDIVAKLKEQGIELARRTVAKYRKIMDIPTARQRRVY